MKNKNIIKFLTEVGKLKKIERRGWVVSGVKKSESVADHTFRTALMVILLGQNRKIDLLKAVKMALIHDIAESEIGDIITWNNLEKTKDEKIALEKKAMKKLVSILGPSGDNYYNLWEEYENCKSPEARFVKDIDKLEMILQAVEYENTEKNLNDYIETFYDKETTYLDNKELIDFFKDILSIRSKGR